MPIYAYRCASCGFQKDHLQKVSDPRLTECPECGKAEYQKMLTAAGFQLKGSGWYVTDFRGNGTGTATVPANSEGASADSGSKDAGAKDDGGKAAEKSSGTTESAPAAATPSSATATTTPT